MQSFGKLILNNPDGQEQTFDLAKNRVSLGRAELNDIPLADAKVSRNHARLDCGPAGCTLVDLNSANGSRLNGQPITQAAPLKPGDLITLGNTSLRFVAAAPTIEADVTILETIADIEATIAQDHFAMTLNDTQVPRLVIVTPGRTWELPLLQESVLIGRQQTATIPLDHPKVSRQHARIERRGDSYLVRDLDSANGTLLGRQRITEHTLQEGDTLHIGDAQLVFKRAFEQEDLTITDSPSQAGATARNPVVIIPGIMGSQLWRGSEQLWPNVRTLLMQPDIFRLPDPPGKSIEARGLVNEVVIVPNLIKQAQYNRLGDYLEEGLSYERGKDLMEFAYDWRQDIRDSARHLAQAIDEWNVSEPITLIAHSLGTLVSRYYVRRLGGNRKVGRLVLLGGPHAGAPKAIASLLTGPDLLPFGLLGDRLRQVMASFPSLYQILPQYACVTDQDGQPIDIFQDETWLPEPLRPHLRASAEFWRELGTGTDVPAVSIFGYGQKTIMRLNVRRDKTGNWQKVDFTSELGGDQTVPEHSAVLPGSEIHPVQQGHGSLYVDNDVKMRLKFELTKR